MAASLRTRVSASAPSPAHRILHFLYSSERQAHKKGTSTCRPFSRVVQRSDAQSNFRVFNQRSNLPHGFIVLQCLGVKKQRALPPSSSSVASVSIFSAAMFVQLFHMRKQKNVLRREMVRKDAKELPFRIPLYPIHKHLEVAVAGIKQTHAGKLVIESAMIGTTSKPPVRATMPSNKYMADLLAVDFPIFMQRLQRFLNEVLEPVLIFQLATPRVGRRMDLPEKSE